SISLFSGCGGIDFAAKACGIDVVLANDNFPEAVSTFKRYFPDTPFYDRDVRELTKFPKADLVTGGYPCQSFSMGGNRSPESDARTYLFKEFARVIDVVSPRFFVAENVSGLKSVQDGRWLQLQLDVYNKIGRRGYNI